MKIPEMAWITQINYTLSYSSVYSIYFIIQNVYIFYLLSYSNSNAYIHIPGASWVPLLLWLDLWIFCARAPSGVQLWMKKTSSPSFTDKAWA